MKRFVFLLVPTVLFSFLLLPTLALAQGNSQREEIKNRIEQRKQERDARIASRAAARKERLNEVKQRICNQKEDQLMRRSQRLAQRAENQVRVFTRIADRVDEYYNNKLVPQGVTIATYSALKANIEAQKLELRTSVNSATTAANNFDCQGEDPKGQLTFFRQEMQTVIAALKDFRTSIKDFIVTIRTAKAKIATDSAE